MAAFVYDYFYKRQIEKWWLLNSISNNACAEELSKIIRLEKEPQMVFQRNHDQGSMNKKEENVFVVDCSRESECIDAFH